MKTEVKFYEKIIIFKTHKWLLWTKIKYEEKNTIMYIPAGMANH
jgi:hypothetical protein